MAIPSGVTRWVRRYSTSTCSALDNSFSASASHCSMDDERHRADDDGGWWRTATADDEGDTLSDVSGGISCRRTTFPKPPLWTALRIPDELMFSSILFQLLVFRLVLCALDRKLWQCCHLPTKRSSSSFVVCVFVFGLGFASRFSLLASRILGTRIVLCE